VAEPQDDVGRLSPDKLVVGFSRSRIARRLTSAHAALLLVVFFTACSRPPREAEGPVAPLPSVEVEPVEESRFVVSIDADGVVYYQGRKVGSAKALESDLAEAFKDIKTDSGRTVQFRCDGSVSRSIFEPVLDAIAAAGGRVLVMAEQTKRMKKN
jgi:biopolymer transport protein ExbD